MEQIESCDLFLGNQVKYVSKSRDLVVIGSLNMDIVTKVNRMPQPGETLMGMDARFVAGGKGNNQAVSAAKLGASVSFVGRVGTDAFGDELKKNLIRNDVKDTYIKVDKENRTGIAQIFVDTTGENIIILSPGANMAITIEDIKEAEEEIKQSKTVVCQLEIPLDAVKYGLELGRKWGKTTILDPAPATEGIQELMPLIDIVTPNESETEILTGIEIDGIQSACEGLEVLEQYGVKFPIITLGKNGVVFKNNEKYQYLEGHSVNVVDTTAAGDTFTGALTAALVRGDDLEASITYANCASAISVGRMGAQTSLPERDEVNEFLLKNPKHVIDL